MERSTEMQFPLTKSQADELTHSVEPLAPGPAPNQAFEAEQGDPTATERGSMQVPALPQTRPLRQGAEKLQVSPDWPNGLQVNLKVVEENAQ